MMNFNNEKWAGFVLLGAIDLIILSVVMTLWDKGRKGYGLNFNAYKDGRLGELVPPKKASANEKRNTWFIFYAILVMFVVYTFMLFNDRKLWS